jgi:hypothetical protein
VEDGIYRLTKSWLELPAQGVDVSGFDLSEVRIYNLGQEIAIHVYDENGDDQFDPEDYIDFYGRAVEESYAQYATDNVYWLALEGGAGAPKRMAAIDGTPGAGGDPGTHVTTVHHEQDEDYVGLAPGGDSLDRWFFSSFVLGDGFQGGGGPVDFILTLPGVAGQGGLKISMWGFYDTDHEVDVFANGTYVGTYNWSGIAFHQVTIDPVNLLPGDNTVTMQCNSGTDGIIVDWFEVVYPRDFAAESDSLQFSHQEGYRYQISGFSGSELLAFDITSPADAKRVINYQVTGTGPYTLDFEPQDGGGTKTYLALSSAAVKTPTTVSEDISANLADVSNGADYIVITHRNLGWDGSGAIQQWLSDLTALRQAQGLRVTVVEVEDIYDEFSYGLVTPAAIRDFLAFAYENWSRPAPQYVLLIGDSTYDSKDNLGLGTTNLVPTYLTFTQYMGETVTDEWFARVSGDDALPDLYVGRLPATSANEASVMVNKIISYEAALNTKTWEKNVLLIADNRIEDYEALFEIMNDDAAQMIPTGLTPPFKGYLNDYLAAGDLNDDIKDEINAGALLVNYSGHATIQIWANEGIFDNADVADLTNDGMFPFVVSMSCLNGYFAYPEAWNFPSLAEALLRSSGIGAAAAFMPTGMTPPEGQHILDTALFDAIFTEDIRALGPAISAAKQTLLANGGLDYEEISTTFLLFGDPAMTLKVPLPHRPEGLRAQGNGNAVDLSWNQATDCNSGAVSGYNLYRSTTPGGTYTQVNTSLITDNQYDDTSVAAGTTYYYVVTSVDADGDESAQSQEASAGMQSANSSGGGGGGGCFVNSVAAE